ncbi:hypothetical protein DIPPA_30442 [Diplonema papillatum]|nr:hypothetical protein DIPPA_30442 [Diplonema papillatum]
MTQCFADAPPVGRSKEAEELSPAADDEDAADLRLDDFWSTGPRTEFDDFRVV